MSVPGCQILVPLGRTPLRVAGLVSLPTFQLSYFMNGTILPPIFLPLLSGIFSGYIRHAQLREFSKYYPDNGPSFWSNILASIIGLISTFGLIILANWQTTYNLKMNYLGANIAIIGLIVYFIIQTVFSFWMAPKMNSWAVFVLRALLCTTSVIVNIARFVCNYQAHICDTERNSGKRSALSCGQGGEGEGGMWYTVHAMTVWLLVFLFSIMALTFFPEFRRIQLQKPVIKMKSSWVEVS